MMEDKEAAREFLDKVAVVKIDRKKRNLQEMQAKLADSNKEDIDFVKANVEDLYGGRAEIKDELKQVAKKIAQGRQQTAKERRADAYEMKQKISVLQLFRWDLIKEKRGEAYEFAMGVQRQSRKMQYWGRLIKTYFLINRLYRSWTTNLQQIKDNLTKNMLIFKLRYIMKRTLERRGKTL